MSFYSERFEVMLHDVDAKNMARPSSIARFLQEAANHQMRDRRPTYHELFNEGKSYILIRFSAQIYRPLAPYEVLDVKTWTSPSKGATFKRNYSIYVGDEKVVDSISEWAVVGPETGKIFGVKDIDVSNYECDEPISMTIPLRFRFPSEIEWKKCGKKRVEYSDCDMNGHMNNTKYQDMLWNRVPEVEDKIVTGFSLRFMSAGLMGSDIEIMSSKAPNPIEDGAGGEESWFFKTLIDGKTNVEALINFRNLK